MDLQCARCNKLEHVRLYEEKKNEDPGKENAGGVHQKQPDGVCVAAGVLLCIRCNGGSCVVFIACIGRAILEITWLLRPVKLL